MPSATLPTPPETPAIEPALGASRAPFWALQAVGWSAFVLALVAPWIGAYPAGSMLITKAPIAVTGLVTTLALRWVYQRLLRGEMPPWVVIAIVVVASWVGALVWTGAADWIARHAAVGELTRGALIRLSLDRMSGTLYYAVVLLTWSALYFGLSHYRALQQARERTLRAEALAQQAQLAALRYQVNPHFLFNALNAVSTLVVERRTVEAARVLARLSELLRAMLDGPTTDECSLAGEVAFVLRYLDIEQVRFGDRLSVTTSLSVEAQSARVPTMLLQPLVENAIRHAVSRREDAGSIAITAVRDGPRLSIEVRDDGPGLAPGAIDGVGLTNTRERLRQLYGDAARLDLLSAPGAGVRARLELPYRNGTGGERTP